MTREKKREIKEDLVNAIERGEVDQDVHLARVKVASYPQSVRCQIISQSNLARPNPSMSQEGEFINISR